MRAIDLIQKRPYQGVLVYGEPGTGKTSWAAQSPSPLFILTEPNGIPSIAQWGPESYVDVCSTYEAVKAAIERVKQAKMGEDGLDVRLANGDTAEGIKTVVFDSLTDIQELVRIYVVGEKPTDVNRRQWGMISAVMGALMHDIRHIVDCHVVCIALADYIIESEIDSHGEEIETHYYYPAISGKVGKRIGQYFTGVGQALRKTENGVTAYGIRWCADTKKARTKQPPKFPPTTVVSVGKGTLGKLLEGGGQ